MAEPVIGILPALCPLTSAAFIRRRVTPAMETGITSRCGRWRICWRRHDFAYAVGWLRARNSNRLPPSGMAGTHSGWRSLPIFFERYVLPILAACLVGVILLNPFKLPRQQQTL